MTRHWSGNNLFKCILSRQQKEQQDPDGGGRPNEFMAKFAVRGNGKQTTRLPGARKDKKWRRNKKKQKGWRMQCTMLDRQCEEWKGGARICGQAETVVKVVFTFHLLGLANSEKDMTAAIKRQDSCQLEITAGGCRLLAVGCCLSTVDCRLAAKATKNHKTHKGQGNVLSP